MNAQKLSIQKIGIALFTTLALQACGGTSPTENTLTPGPELFSAVTPDDTTTQSLVQSSEDTTRTRYVKINFEALTTIVENGKGTLNLNLFADKSVLVTIEQMQKLSESNFILSGKIAGDEDSAVTISKNEEVLIANVRSGKSDDAFEVRYGGSQGIHLVAETNGTNDEPCSAEEAVAEEGDEPMIETQQDSILATPIIDMLVAYTPKARIKQGGTSAIKALIQTGIADTNLALQNSGASMRVRLAGTMELQSSETCNWSTDLNSLRSKTDSKWNDVHTERARLGADQVTVVGAYNCTSSTAGIGYINAYKATAFTIVKSSAFGMYTFAHELGHNLGLNHSDGYVNSAGRFRTIMAYGSYKRIRRFSNPNISYNGYRTGTSYDYSVRIINANDYRVSTLLAPVASAASAKVNGPLY